MFQEQLLLCSHHVYATFIKILNVHTQQYLFICEILIYEIIHETLNDIHWIMRNHIILYSGIITQHLNYLKLYEITKIR